MNQQVRNGINGPGSFAGHIQGIDSLEQRPGVPREAEPRPDAGAHWQMPVQQPKRLGRVKRSGLDELTPVYGTAQPLRGISGLMRRVAYRRPEHEVRHWVLLLAADRVDVQEGRLGRLLSRPLRDTRLDTLGRAIERRPLLTLLLSGGALVLGSWALRRES